MRDPSVARLPETSAINNDEMIAENKDILEDGL